MIFYKRILKYKKFLPFWFFFVSKANHISYLNRKYALQVWYKRCCSKYSIFVSTLKKLIKLLGNGFSYTAFLFCLNFIYSTSGLKKRVRRYTRPKASNKVFLDFIFKIRSTGIAVLFNTKYSTTVLTTLKDRRFIIIGFADYCSSDTLMDLKIVLDIKRFYNIYFFAKFLIAALIKIKCK